MTSGFSWQNFVSLWPAFVLQGQICPLLQVFVDLLLFPVPYDEKDFFFGC